MNANWRLWFVKNRKLPIFLRRAILALLSLLIVLRLSFIFPTRGQLALKVSLR